MLQSAVKYLPISFSLGSSHSWEYAEGILLRLFYKLILI